MEHANGLRHRPRALRYGYASQDKLREWDCDSTPAERPEEGEGLFDGLDTSRCSLRRTLAPKGGVRTGVPAQFAINCYEMLSISKFKNRVQVSALLRVRDAVLVFFVAPFVLQTWLYVKIHSNASTLNPTIGRLINQHIIIQAKWTIWGLKHIMLYFNYKVAQPSQIG